MLNVDYMISLIPMFNLAALVTIQLTLLGVFFSFLIGILGNLSYYYKVPVLTQFFKAYTELSRNTPILAHLFFLFFGLPAINIYFSGFVSGVIALSFLGGSYMIEAIRGGFEAVAKIQKETAKSLALSKWQILKFVVAPQGLRTALPAIVANVIFLLRESALVSVIAVPELMLVARSEISMFFRTNEVLIVLTLYYLVLIGPLSLGFSFLERKVRNGKS